MKLSKTKLRKWFKKLKQHLIDQIYPRYGHRKASQLGRCKYNDLKNARKELNDILDQIKD
jgi:hypothetical protein